MSHQKNARKVDIFFSNFDQRKWKSLRKIIVLTVKCMLPYKKKCQVKIAQFCTHSEICKMSKDVFAKALEMQRTRDLIGKMHYKRLKKISVALSHS